MNNAFSTFFVAGLYMMFWDWFLEGIKAKKATQIMKSILCCFIPILCAFPMLLVGMVSANENIPAFLRKWAVAPVKDPSQTCVKQFTRMNAVLYAHYASRTAAAGCHHSFRKKQAAQIFPCIPI